MALHLRKKELLRGCAQSVLDAVIYEMECQRHLAANSDIPRIPKRFALECLLSRDQFGETEFRHGSTRQVCVGKGHVMS
jgi:hypothetical protein